MKRHHIVGIFLGICAIGLATRSALSGNIVEALLYFTALSPIAVSGFFKDRLSANIVGISIGICAIGLAMRSALSGDIFGALIYFTALSAIAVSSFFKDRLSPRWSHKILPFWMGVVLILIFLFELVFAFYSFS